MNMISKDSINLEQNILRKLQTSYISQIKALPQGSLFYKLEHGKARPYICKNKKVKYLSKKEQSTIEALKRKSMLKKAIADIGTNLNLLKQMENEYTEINECVPEIYEEKYDINMHNLQLQRRNTYRPEKKIHISPAGVKVRSKAELIIAAFLESKGIEYLYEVHFNIGERNMYPDFTIVRKSDGKVIIWEHFGKMDDPGYVENAFDKIRQYIENGYTPYVDFIMTFGDNDSGVDMGLLEFIVENMLR